MDAMSDGDDRSAVANDAPPGIDAWDDPVATHPAGLFPAPLPVRPFSPARDAVEAHFRSLGRVVGRAMMDQQVLPIQLSPLAIKIMMMLAGIASDNGITATREDSVKGMLASMARAGGWKGLYGLRVPGDDQGSEAGPWRLPYPAFERDFVKQVMTQYYPAVGSGLLAAAEVRHRLRVAKTAGVISRRDELALVKAHVRLGGSPAVELLDNVLAAKSGVAEIEAEIASLKESVASVPKEAAETTAAVAMSDDPVDDNSDSASKEELRLRSL